MDIATKVNIGLCILSFILAVISVVTVVIILRQNSKMLESSTRPYVSIYFQPLFDTNYLVLKNFGNSTAKVEDDCKKAIEFDLSKFSDNTSPDLLELSNNCTLRKKNAHIANNLLPIFKKNPKTWHAIPFLCLIRPNQDISSSLKEWIVLSPPESRNGLVEVARVFGVSESLL